MMEKLLLINKFNRLNNNFKPTKLVKCANSVPCDILKKYTARLDEETNIMLNKLIKEAKEEGITVFVEHGYRSTKEQEKIYNHFLSVDPEIAALPGHSEHETGLAVDISILDKVEDGVEKTLSTAQMWSNRKSIWIMENAHRFGFVLRYPR